MKPLVTPHLLSHGTVECQDMAKTRRFYEEFLGIDVIRPLPEAQYMWRGGAWTVVCVHVDGEPKEQGPENRFELALASASDVKAAHAAALAQKSAFDMKKVTDLSERNGIVSFMIQDLDNAWWEISNVTLKHYDDLFEKGDIAA
jgi:catechol 2,3-dioxygenase-like lactoylglutathione lyase family enzyme